MRVLVISDIHANLTALETVLEDARQFDYQAVWCLGDIVGYGPEPDECIEQIRMLASVCVVGNHDWAVLGQMDVDEFNAEARRAVLWTREHISQANLAWLGQQPHAPIIMGSFTITHGSPRDPIWEYVLYPATARVNFEFFSTPYCLVGHTHVPALYILPEPNTTVRALSPTPGQTIALRDLARSGNGRVIMNPGSVGQPRDNDPRTAYAIVDTENATWLPRRVSYPFEITQAHMRAAGLPERLINRLAFGW